MPSLDGATQCPGQTERTTQVQASLMVTCPVVRPLVYHALHSFAPVVMLVVVCGAVNVGAADGREDAIELLKQLFMGHVHGLKIDRDLRGHILVRLKRLCAIPGDGRLSSAAKKAFQEAFLVREEQHSVLCFGGGGRASGQSVAGRYWFYRPPAQYSPNR